MKTNSSAKKVAAATLLLAVGAAAAFALSKQDQAAPNPGRQRTRVSDGVGGVIPEVMRRVQERADLVTQARKAERRGDYAEAEGLFRRAANYLWAPDPSVHRDLARLYEAQGREPEAFVEYRLFIAGQKDFWSSGQEDPRLLARYGDLCLRYSTVEEAAKAFGKASSRVHRDPAVGEPDPEPREQSLAAYRAAAYTAAGMRLMGGGNDRAGMRELDRAVLADPGYWVPRFYRAREYMGRGRLAEAVREAALAERLAPPAQRTLVLRMRSKARIPDSQGKLIPFDTFFRPDPDSIWKPERASTIPVPPSSASFEESAASGR